jgi:methylthioribose-1-phosphate isomerase
MSGTAVVWGDGPAGVLTLLDQTRLPTEEVFLEVTSVEVLIDAIQRLAVRGAPALGAVGALGVVVALDEAAERGWGTERLEAAIEAIRSARPTAVNLAWGVDQVRHLVPAGRTAVLSAALDLVAEDGAANRELSRLGSDWLLARSGDRPLRIQTHCNTGFLATTAWGTGLGIVRELVERDRLELVHVDETRPLLQGSRLTAWELAGDGIPYVVQPDGAAAGAILGGAIDAVIIGADRIAANGDTANKVGSLGLALAAHAAGIPFIVAAPWSTVDLATPDGSVIEIEERAADEVTTFAGVRVAPAGARVYNPAFDVTPARYISAVVTERGVVEPALGESMGLLDR